MTTEQIEAAGKILGQISSCAGCLTLLGIAGMVILAALACWGLF